MAFCIKMQPFLADRYYHYLKEAFPEQAMDAFMTAFHRYASQRGIRAAQRAIRDGAPLNFEHYQKYREVVSTPQMREIDGPGRSEHTVTENCYTGHVYECSSHNCFRELNSPEEVEQFFCYHIDRFNVHGFNPDLPYEVISTLCDSSCCVHRAGPTPIRPGAELGKRMEDAPPYPFIVANEYFTMKKMITAIFGEPGRSIAEAVKEEFIRQYGSEDWAELCRYQHVDFDIHYPLCLDPQWLLSVSGSSGTSEPPRLK